MARCMPSGMPEVAPDPLYRLLAWLSPAYPIGAFSYSHGVETAVEEGFIKDRASLIEILPTLGYLGLITALVMGFSVWRFNKGRIFE